MRQARRGFLILDVITGMFLFVTLATALVIGLSGQARGAARLSDSRAALRAAEAALTQMQAGAPLPTAVEGVSIEVHGDLTAPASAGMRWLRVEATCNGHRASLVGLAPLQGGGR